MASACRCSSSSVWVSSLFSILVCPQLVWRRRRPNLEQVSKSTTLDLLERWRAGDPEALNALLRRDMDWIGRRVHRQLGAAPRRAGDTSDIVQETAMAILNAGPRFVLSDHAQFRALVAQIIVNVVRGQHRQLHALKRGGHAESLPPTSVLDLDGRHEPPPAPDDAAAQAEEREWLRMGLLLLEADDQAVLDLFWRGQTDAEIAKELDLSINTARMRRSRATKRLVGVVRKLKQGRVGELVDPADD